MKISKELEMGKGTFIERPAGDALISFSDNVILTHKTCVSVPIQYKAIVYVDDCSVFRIDPCKKIVFVKKYGDEYVGRKIKLAYIHWVNIERTAWSLDSYNVNLQDKTKLEIFSHGGYSFEIVNYPRFISGFPDKKNITVADVRKKVGSAVCNIVSDAVTECAQSGISPDSEIALEKIKSVFNDELLLSAMGVRITRFDIALIDVNDPRLQKEAMYV